MRVIMRVGIRVIMRVGMRVRMRVIMRAGMRVKMRVMMRVENFTRFPSIVNLPSTFNFIMMISFSVSDRYCYKIFTNIRILETNDVIGTWRHSDSNCVPFD